MAKIIHDWFRSKSILDLLLLRLVHWFLSPFTYLSSTSISRNILSSWQGITVKYFFEKSKAIFNCLNPLLFVKLLMNLHSFSFPFFSSELSVIRKKYFWVLLLGLQSLPSGKTNLIKFWSLNFRYLHWTRVACHIRPSRVPPLHKFETTD